MYNYFIYRFKLYVQICDESIYYYIPQVYSHSQICHYMIHYIMLLIGNTEHYSEIGLLLDKFFNKMKEDSINLSPLSIYFRQDLYCIILYIKHIQNLLFLLLN